ncbi:putative DUF4245 family protein [Corynebacterium mustelae]|uniref:Putative DUF4245 family protein n=2 Tax=Corynebacterium mustelae TaxID=571915 RepID=A0A0G3H2V3_9CORY|nr:putative DUF4245 family protein [Corynebacterium mustelae]
MWEIVTQIGAAGVFYTTICCVFLSECNYSVSGFGVIRHQDLQAVYHCYTTPNRFYTMTQKTQMGTTQCHATPRCSAIRAILVAVAEEKPRIFQSGRDIALSLAAVLAVMIVSVAFTGMCSYGRDTAENVQINKVDAAAFFDLEARAMNFPLRLPEVPAGWVANSARRGAVDGQPAPIVGWVIGKDGYVQLTQTDVPADKAVTGADNNFRELVETYDVDGVAVSRYASEDADVRDIRVADLGDVRLLVTGAATKEQFDDLISRTIASEPIKKQL